MHNMSNSFGEQQKIGTRVIYDRSTLLALSNSQLAKTPPTKMMYVAGVTKAGGQENGNNSLHPSSATSHRRAAELKREEEAKKKTCKSFVGLKQATGERECVCP
ncbi:hypothetical protein BDB00DRAFT_820672 [Zychaea mexicana]|uniref:uncharacterized protein n=1 Tax=Zychaea mexicana TaxID=64656 RepID=UPI0022FEFE46|nr:uncharacterized protein BDB00DRAFT_820672 [Zychaea mexicana]KAI9494049.1 hypothetical protein BDB00DRAFT_820672 [Zychaea mexicana]